MHAWLYYGSARNFLPHCYSALTTVRCASLQVGHNHLVWNAARRAHPTWGWGKLLSASHRALRNIPGAARGLTRGLTRRPPHAQCMTIMRSFCSLSFHADGSTQHMNKLCA